MNDDRPPEGHVADPVDDALGRSSALTDVGRVADAEAVLRRALAGEPEEPFLLTELARVLIVADRAAEAVGPAERAVAADPGLSRAHAMRALALAEDPKRRAEAVAAAETAVELEPEGPFARRVLARAYLRARRGADALVAADAAVRLAPESADAHGTRGAVLLELDRPVDAEAAYREALRRDPRDVEALNNLGVAIQAQGGARGGEARELFEQAARELPSDPVARGNLAADARAWVNGRWAWGVVIYAVVRLLGALASDDPDRWTVVAVAGAVAVGLSAYLLDRGRRRRATLSPAAQRLLREQRWWERTQATSWRPIFWFVPAPIWVGLSALGACFWGGDLLFGSPESPTATGVALGLSLVVLALTGRRTWQRWGASWWAGRRG